MTVRGALIIAVWLVFFVWLVVAFRAAQRSLERDMREFDDHADQALRIVAPEDRADWPPR